MTGTGDDPITGDMADLLAGTGLAYVASVNPDGTPNLSPKSSVRAYDGRNLIFANVASPRTIRNIALNPVVEINVFDPARRRGFRFRGSAELVHDPELVELVSAELGPEYPIDGVVRIRIESATPVWSPVYSSEDLADQPATGG